MAKKKFDTNPLDPEFPKKVGAQQRLQDTETLPYAGAETRKFEQATETEEQTRRFNEANFNGAYNSPYDGSQIPSNYQTARFYKDDSPSRKVAKVGLPENILTALPYLPFWIGLIAGVLELFFVPKSETKVRFHAAQGLAAHIGILIVTAILEGVSNIPGFGLAGVGNGIFWVVTTVMLVIFAIKAWRGKPVHIESVDDLTEWLEDKIKPRQ